MLGGMLFAFWRFLEIVTLIPTLSMLAWFVHIYTVQNELTPSYVLVLFIVSVLAAVWAIATLFTYHRARSNAYFVSLVDLCFVGAFIAGAYYLRGIAAVKCSALSNAGTHGISFGIFGSATLNGIGIGVDKPCAMLKAAFAFAIMNCIFFFFTAFLALVVGRGEVGSKETYVRETYHSHRRSGSHRSQRSSHSGRRRAYV